MLTVTIVYKDIEGGFWGMITEDGKQYLPMEFPEQLKHEGRSVAVTLQEIDVMTSMSWGIPVEIVSFSTVSME